MNRKIPIIVWDSTNGAEPAECFRMDKKVHRELFFNVLLDNAEFDGRDTFYIKRVTEKEWAKIDRAGKEMA